MVLTNMLPNQGNGTYRFFMYAQDREGHTTLLGTRTMTCENASATKPFGAIDTPTQGGVGVGCELCELRLGADAAAENDSDRWLDDQRADRWRVDRDRATTTTSARTSSRCSQDSNNTNGAVGFRVIDTTTLTNGLHTISWTVVDNRGAIEGIGSRFFTVSNGAGA